MESEDRTLVSQVMLLPLLSLVCPVHPGSGVTIDLTLQVDTGSTPHYNFSSRWLWRHTRWNCKHNGFIITLHNVSDNTTIVSIVKTLTENVSISISDGKFAASHLVFPLCEVQQEAGQHPAPPHICTDHHHGCQHCQWSGQCHQAPCEDLGAL